MMNYISAELYKLRHKKLLFVGVGVILALESLVFWPSFWIKEDLAFRRELLYGFFAAALYPMVVLPPVFATLVFDDQHGHGTLKNEAVYGIPRARTYLGKLIAAAIAGTASAMLVTAWYLLLCQLVGAPQLLWGAPTLGWLLKALLAHWCIWMALLSFSFLLLMVVRNAAGALVAVYVTVLLVTPFSLMEWSGDAPLWLRSLCELFFTAPMLYISTGDGQKGSGLIYQLLGENWLVYSAAVGTLWVAGTTALGLFVFDRREIK